MKKFRNFLGFSLVFFFILTLSGFLFTTTSAQIGQGINSPDELKVEPGSIISRNSQTGYFYLSREISSPNIFGVIVEKPLMNINPNEESDVSVLRTGQVRVNVILDEDIKTGDSITTSVFPGYGMRADDSHQYIVGVALEDLSVSQSTGVVLSDSGEEVLSGRVLIDLKIGPVGMSEEDYTPPSGQEGSLIGQIEHYIAVVARYLSAAIVAIGALYFSYRFFNANVKDGLSALGRNPLARQSIQKMMFFNMFLIILISIGGLLLSVLILLIPILIIKVM